MARLLQHKGTGIVVTEPHDALGADDGFGPVLGEFVQLHAVKGLSAEVDEGADAKFLGVAMVVVMATAAFFIVVFLHCLFPYATIV